MRDDETILAGIAEMHRIAMDMGAALPVPEAGGGGGVFGSLISGAMSLFGGGFKAEGGPVAAGVPYVVGERGPEWFLPRENGTVLPNGVQPGGGGQVVNFSMNIDARGATPDAVAMLRTQIPALAKAAVEDAARRGGSFSRSVRGR